VGLALVEQLRRPEPQRREPRDLVERARIEEQQLLGQVAEEADRAAGRELRGVAAGDPGEEPDLRLPAVPRRITAQARDPGEALEAVQAVTVERDEEVEARAPWRTAAAPREATRRRS
jgi:hypothetical protein